MQSAHSVVIVVDSQGSRRAVRQDCVDVVFNVGILVITAAADKEPSRPSTGTFEYGLYIHLRLQEYE